MRVLRVAFFSSLALELGATISTAVIAVEIGLRLLNGVMPFQTALFVLLLAPEYFLPLRLLGARHHAGMTGKVALQRMAEILGTPSSVTQPTFIGAESATHHPALDGECTASQGCKPPYTLSSGEGSLGVSSSQRESHAGSIRTRACELHLRRPTPGFARGVV